MCKNKECKHTTFPESYSYNACNPQIKEKIFDLTVNGNGTWVIGRILNISKDTVTSVLKKEDNISQINDNYIKRNKEDIDGVTLVRVDESEMDEMGAVYTINLINVGYGGLSTIKQVNRWSMCLVQRNMLI